MRLVQIWVSWNSYILTDCSNSTLHCAHVRVHLNARAPAALNFYFLCIVCLAGGGGSHASEQEGTLGDALAIFEKVDRVSRDECIHTKRGAKDVVKRGEAPGWSVSQFSFRPSLVPSVTVVLLRFSDRWERGEGRLAKPGAGLIQPLCRRDGHGRPG